MQCRVCGKEFDRSPCPNCGYDASLDRELFPTLCNDGKVLPSPSRPIERPPSEDPAPQPVPEVKSRWNRPFNLLLILAVVIAALFLPRLLREETASPAKAETTAGGSARAIAVPTDAPIKNTMSTTPSLVPTPTEAPSPMLEPTPESTVKPTATPDLTKTLPTWTIDDITYTLDGTTLIISGIGPYLKMNRIDNWSSIQETITEVRIETG